MGSYFNKEKKKENEYINKIKDYNVDCNDIDNEIEINKIVLVKCLKEIIEEIEEIQSKDRARFHMMAPKLDFCSMSII